MKSASTGTSSPAACKCRCTCPKPPADAHPHLERLLHLGRKHLGEVKDSPWRELIGEPDEVDEFFRLPRGQHEQEGSMLVLRVHGRNDDHRAWVH